MNKVVKNSVLFLVLLLLCSFSTRLSSSMFFPHYGQVIFDASSGSKTYGVSVIDTSAHLEKSHQVGDRSKIYCLDNKIFGQEIARNLPVPAQPGPHLFLDDYLIEESVNIERIIKQPQRDSSISNPVVTGVADRCFQPFFTVLRDKKNGHFRIWYGVWKDDKSESRSNLATMESKDGIHFIRPYQICESPEIQFGSSVVDRGPDSVDPISRYIYSYYFGGGTRLLKSNDGLKWTPLGSDLVFKHNHDITGLSWDSVRHTYVAILSSYITGANWANKRRVTMMSFSNDLQTWEKPWFVVTPNDKLDKGDTQFYAMDGFINRGQLRIAMVKVLRDDLNATEIQPGSYGTGYTSLAWSRDGRTWIRDQSIFFAPDDNPHAWDHSHTWIDEQLIFRDSVYLYYAGYKQGHKVNRFKERQIGLVRIPLDRYVGRQSKTVTPGRLKTVPLKLNDSVVDLQVNADASEGELWVQIRNARNGKIIRGFSFLDCDPIITDGLHQVVHWRRGNLSCLAGQDVQVEFQLTKATIFAFEFISENNHDFK